MRTKISQWKDGLTLHIPPSIVDEAHLESEMEVEVSLENGRLIIQPVLSEEEAIEAKWDEMFARSQDLLETWADEALKEHREGKTIPIDRDER
jgi:antitoxin component of MazEF toxin-antitoxin module